MTASVLLCRRKPMDMTPSVCSLSMYTGTHLPENKPFIFMLLKTTNYSYRNIPLRVMHLPAGVQTTNWSISRFYYISFTKSESDKICFQGDALSSLWRNNF